MYLLELLAFLVSSGVSLFLVLKRVPTPNLLQITSILILVFMVIYKRALSGKSNALKTVMRMAVLLTSSGLIQILVLSTGGFLSPFLILLHLYTLGSSFLLSLSSSVLFLLCSVAVLVAQIIIDKNIQQLFLSDPWTIALLSISFIVIIPLAQLLTKTYRIKDVISKLLRQEVTTKDSILKGVNEMIILTNTDALITQVNEVAQRQLRINEAEALDQPLLKIVPFKDSTGTIIDDKAFELQKVFINKANYLINELYLENSLGALTKISLQIRPIFAENGKIEKLAFVIHQFTNNIGHNNLKQVITNHSQMLSQIKQLLRDRHSNDILARLELVEHIEEDIREAEEITDHPIEPKISSVDIPYLCEQVVESKQTFARNLGVALQFTTPADPQEAAFLSLKKSNAPKELLLMTDYSLPIDASWLSALLSNLIELSIILKINGKDPTVHISTNKMADKLAINIDLLNFPNAYDTAAGVNLFKEYYGGLNIKNLGLGSGLEGYIAKSIAFQLGMAVSASFNKISGQLNFQIAMNRKPH